MIQRLINAWGELELIPSSTWHGEYAEKIQEMKDSLDEMITRLEEEEANHG